MDLTDLKLLLDKLKKKYGAGSFISFDKEDTQKLILEYEKIGEFRVFKDRKYMHFFCASGRAWTYEELTFWIGYQLKDKEPGELISIISEYLSSPPEKEVVRILPLANVTSDTGYKFDNGVELIHIDDLVKQSFAIPNIEKTQFYGWCLAFRITAKLEILDSGKETEVMENYSQLERSADEKLMQTNMIMNLCRPLDFGIQHLGMLTKCKPCNIISDGNSYSIIPANRSNLMPSVLKVELEKADDLVKKFEDFVEKEKLEVPLKRLSIYMSGENIVDKLIALRIMLENIFLNEDEALELSYRLSIRFARFSQSDPSKRSEAKKIAKKVYRITSNAIHNGKVTLTKAEHKLLDSSAQTCRNTVIKMLTDGVWPSWDDIELE